MNDGDSSRVGKPRHWRRWIANLLILAGLLVLLYPFGTCGYARLEQRRLATQLRKIYPNLGVDVSNSVHNDFARQQTEMRDLQNKAREAEWLAELAAFRKAAGKFSSSNSKSAGEPLGRIVIPKIGVNVVVIEGVGRSDLGEGPGHWPETPLPGMAGNFVMSGHRTTYGGPFFKLDKLRPGDEIDMLLPYATVRYRVTRTVIVKPDEVGVVEQRGKEEISLATCHPIYSARQRLVVQGELDGFSLTKASAAKASSSLKGTP